MSHSLTTGDFEISPSHTHINTHTRKHKHTHTPLTTLLYFTKESKVTVLNFSLEQKSPMTV